ncbi:hypothetical protein [Allocoleopsis sp.]|uniref:hypothetical protein n=1 Tax=Allocoleopsis sp. TaxID=3088169 RepID=UPI002FCF721B
MTINKTWVNFNLSLETGYLEERVRYLNHGETYTFNVFPSLWQQVLFVSVRSLCSS